MRTALLAVLAAALLYPVAASAQLPGEAVPSGSVELLANFPQHNDAAGGRRVGNFFYITTERDLTIYDISKPAQPKEVGRLAFDPTLIARDYYLDVEEDVDTNGTLLLSSRQNTIEVIDVSDKTDPKIVGRAGDKPQHTISCVLDCRYAYGSSGAVVDLTDPADPKVIGDWTRGRAVARSHDVTEVAPGMVLTSTVPMYLLDARQDPANPQTVAVIGDNKSPFVHANLWPNNMTDKLALVGGEAMGPQCAEDPDATFRTYDTSNWAATGTFAPLDQFSLDTGLLVDGRMVDSTFCVHWLAEHPTFRNGGLVAIAWYEHGTRFLKIGENGSITEVGSFLPLGTQASATFWITEDILYIVDYVRGLDVVRYKGSLSP